MRQSGIGMAVFEIRGKHRKKLFEYSTTPEHYKQGIETINSKFGMGLRAHSEKIAKQLRY